MNEIFGDMDGRFEVYLADSTMMWIVHSAMNKAQEKMKTKTGVIERLNEISKFYELAVMQLEGCLSIVHAETESTSIILESNHEEVLDELREIKDHLQRRLKESEFAMFEKDRELTQRLENELQLRHALELKERELVSLGVTLNHEIETEVQQIVNVKQRVEQQEDMLIEVQQNGTKRIEEISSDIDILKQSMDLAFGKMQSTLLFCEMGSKERQWKLAIEKDIMSIFIGSFMREFQDNTEKGLRRYENHVQKFLQENWPQLMNEVTNLQQELANLCETCPEDSDCSALSSPTTSSTEEASHDIPFKFPQKMEEKLKEQKSIPQEEENEDGSNYVAKMIKNHETIIRQKNEELNLSKHGISQEKRASFIKKRKALNSMMERMHAISDKLDSLVNWNAKLSESLFNQRAIHDTMGKVKKGVCDAEKEYNTMQNSISDGIYGSIDGLVEEFECKSYNFELEKQIQEQVYEHYLREVIHERNENIERSRIEKKIGDAINLIVLSEKVKDMSTNPEFAVVEFQGGEDDQVCLKCLTSSNQVDESEIEVKIKVDIMMLIFGKTLDEFNKMMLDSKDESIIREQIHQIVFAETLKNFVSISTSASIQDDFLDQLQLMYIENLLKEDVCEVVFKAMLKEWKLELENHYYKEKSQVQNNNSIQENCSTLMLNQVQKVKGEERLTVILLESLLSSFEAEENLMLSAKSEIKEHSKQLDLGSEQGDLHEHEIFEDLLTGEEQTFSSLTSKVENVLQQLGISKALLKRLGTSLGHSLRDSESFQNQIMCANEEEGILKLPSSTLLPLLDLLPAFAELEAMVCEKFEMMTMRLERMKCCLDPVIELVDCMRSKELLYQKAFIRRCHNLRKAEAEVDLLGDQVDALITLLEKIYVTIHKRAPALQQHFEVYDILALIKAELIRGNAQATSIDCVGT